MPDQNDRATSPGQSFPGRKIKSLYDVFRIHDDRGNLLNVPIDQQQPNGVYRTYLSSNNPTSVMVKIQGKDSDKYPMGFTPEENFYVQGDKLIDPDTGFPVEKGNVVTGQSLNKNTSVNKISKTYLNVSPSNGSPLDGSVGSTNLFLSKESIPNRSNKYGDVNVSGGFTNPLLYVQNPNNINDKTGLPKELGDMPTNNDKMWGPHYNIDRNRLIKSNPNTRIYGDGNEIGSPTKEMIGMKEVYDLFDNEEQFDFVHVLDRRIPISEVENKVDGYLASYVSTTDNEDPTMFGYDIIIDFSNSPLFNGSIPDFIDKFGESEDGEIGSRKSIWLAFCKQFFKFFKTNSKEETKNLESKYGASYSLPVNDTDFVKTYYLKKISGLDKLVESGVSITSDSVKSMVEYGKDSIRLSLYEDVSVNTGYLSALYKTLSWSRLHGKQIIPENLLRFDAKITITEIREYNKVIKDLNNSNVLNVFADKLSKYTYNLYDCQFSFDKLSHGDEIDMTSPSIVDSFDISFNYKYSSLQFQKFLINNDISDRYVINNESVDVNKLSSLDSQGVLNEDGTITQIDPPVQLQQYDQYPTRQINRLEYAQPTPLRTGALSLADVKNIEKSKLNFTGFDKWKDFSESDESSMDKIKRNQRNREMLENLGKKLKKAAIGEINRRIIDQARLLNRTLDNIRNQIGLGKMSAPTNVYDQDFFRSDITNAFRDFIGQSVRGFFTPPR